jgi:hypothetical protein
MIWVFLVVHSGRIYGAALEMKVVKRRELIKRELVAWSLVTPSPAAECRVFQGSKGPEF